ncbi:Alkaline phosphatase tissue-nonspecific isozyme [Taenia crassiceps]|uniref:Alkaline phosphatase n=1 Tax=Taenia crassiceps TaxID=6207 RepID=A0ABR4QNH8_9CEST
MMLKDYLIGLPLYLFLFSLLDHLCTSAVLAARREPENNEVIAPAFWERLARERFKRSNRIFSAPQERAKNVILFLGDGMGMPTISAGRFFKAEVENRLSEANPMLSFEDWPFHTMCRTYNLQTTVTDSASSATAYLGGTKTLTKVIGLTGAVDFKSCRKYTPEEKVESVLKAAMDAGMATGIVTTSRVTHASPAGAFAHTASRQWESDRQLVKDCPDVSELPKDIARQLVEENLNINVVLGGGFSTFFPREDRGERLDGRSLAQEWLANQTSRGCRAKLITEASQFMTTDLSKVDYLLGLLDSSHLPYDADRKENEPSLANLTTVAIKILSRQPKGFFLFVEGARIDHAHHSNLGKKALLDLLAFEEAIRAGTLMVNLEETLVIVTADHSHSFMLGGEPNRKRSLLDVDTELAPFILDKKGMLPLVYSSGPAGAVNTTRLNLTALPKATLRDTEFRQPALVPLPWATHGGEDVGVYATGVFSYLFHSTVDNTFIGQAMKSKKAPPDGWEMIEPTIDELNRKMREAETDPHEGKRKVEAEWPIFRIHHKRSRYIYDLYFKRKVISKRRLQMPT